MSKAPRKQTTDKIDELEPNVEHGANTNLTTNHGLPINDDQNSLKVAPSKVATAFIAAIGEHRHWSRELNDAISA